MGEPTPAAGAERPETVSELLTRARTREGAAIDGVDRSVAYEYDELVTDAWKAGNLLRHYGVRPGARAAVVPNRTPAAVIAVLGGLAAGATVELIGPDTAVSARALVAPPGEYETAPGCSRLAYGDSSDRPEVASFEGERWSENPIAPPGDQSPGDEALRSKGDAHTHRVLLGTARAIAADRELEPGDRVGVSAPLETVGGFLGGVLVPLAAGATIRFNEPGDLTVRETGGDIAVEAVADRLSERE